MCFHHVQDKTVKWQHSISQARRDEQRVNAKFGGIFFLIPDSE
jgi:hypothetical protein